MIKTRLLLFGLLLFLAAAVSPGCSRKSGCPATDSLQAPVNRKGELKSKKGSSGLFSKKMSRRMR